MPRIIGGHTELGSILNKQSQKTEHVTIDKINLKRATIVESFNNLYVFIMRLSDSNKLTKPIPIVGSVDELAMRFGSPKEMEGKWEVLISYKGNSANRGVAHIIGRLGTTIGAQIEETEQSNQLLVQGTAFAPPGSSM